MDKNKNFTFIDLFCGCGGFSKGLEAAGHNCLLGIDFDQHAVESFKHNHKNAKGMHMDITKLKKSELLRILDNQKVDMVVGGPPCQGFSTVGRGDINDERNSLFKHFIRVVRILNPKIVIFENVTGILAQKNEFTLKQIFKEFEKLGFNMSAEVLDASDFGVPSRRRRTIIMGVKNDIPLFPKPLKKKVNAKSVFDKINKLKKPINHDLQTAQIKNPLDQKRLKHIPAGMGIRYQRDEEKYLPKRLRYDVNWETLREHRFRQTRLQRIPLDTPAPTILTSRSMYYHPIENRYLTTREAAGLQSFPLQFEFHGPLSAQFRQIGNAVPPKLAQEIGKVIKNFSFKKKKAIKALDAKKLSSKAFVYKENKYA